MSSNMEHGFNKNVDSLQIKLKKNVCINDGIFWQIVDP